MASFLSYIRYMADTVVGHYGLFRGWWSTWGVISTVVFPRLMADTGGGQDAVLLSRLA